MDSWLAWKLSGGALHVTDVSNASRTMLYNIHAGAWDEELLDLFRIPRALLPRVLPSSHVYGESAKRVFGAPIPIAGIAGDQQAALFGQACHAPGMAKNTYGTGCFMLLNTGAKAVPSRHGLLTTCCAQPGSKPQYALEGSVFAAGAVVQWLRDGLGIIRASSEIEALAASVDDTGGVYLVPAFAGLGAPHWDAYARGAMLGLTRGTTRAHIARAALEAIAFQSAELLQAMQQDAGLRLTELRVDGGATANAMLMQFQADILGVPVVRPKWRRPQPGAALWPDRHGRRKTSPPSAASGPLEPAMAAPKPRRAWPAARWNRRTDRAQQGAAPALARTADTRLRHQSCADGGDTSVAAPELARTAARPRGSPIAYGRNHVRTLSAILITSRTILFYQ